MRYDIIINLDYGDYPHEELQALFERLKRMLLDQGFVMDGRRFSTDFEPERAKELVRSVIDEIDMAYQKQGKSVYPMIRECFGFDHDNAANLLLPPTEEIDVEELAGVEGLEIVELFKRD